MSTENRSKTPVFIGFGALIAVVIVAIALWPTNFRKEDASGAIGAVQKHRAPQITQKDVILGDESFKHQQKVLYADFVADAEKLRAMAESKNFAGATAELNALANELQARYVSAAREALAASREQLGYLMNPMNKENLASRVEYKDREAANRAYLKESEVAARSAKMQSAINEMNSILKRSELSDADREQLNGKLGLIIVVCAKTMSRTEAAERELAAVSSRLEHAQAANEFQAAAKQLGDVQELLARPLYSVSLADEASYLAAMQKEMRMVAEAEQAYAAKKFNDQQLSSRLIQASEELQSRAAENIKANTELMNEMAARLSAMDQAMARLGRFELGKMAGRAELGQAELGKAVAAAKSELQSRDNEFYARAAAASGEQLAVAKSLQNEELANNLANLQARLQSRQQQ